jgi:hypothetical protein
LQAPGHPVSQQDCRNQSADRQSNADRQHFNHIRSDWRRERVQRYGGNNDQLADRCNAEGPYRIDTFQGLLPGQDAG